MAEQTQTNITAYGRPKSSREGGSTVINYTVNGGGYGSSNINARSATINRIKSELIDTNILNAGTGNFVYLVATDGTISTLRGTDLNYQSGYIDELQASKIKAHELTMNEPTDIAKITTIFNEYLQGKEIVTDYLTVNKAAHFFEVVIDKIKSVGGTIINTACNSTIDYVQGLDANDELTDNPIKYRCYFKRTQDDGTHITNDWKVNDQAICQACNLVPGTSYNKGTHYYWRLVVDRNNENAPVYVNFNTGEVDDESTTQPDYFVVFKHGEGTSVIFTYDKTIGNDGGTPVKKTVTAYTSTGDIATDMTDTSDGIQLKIEDTIHGLSVVPDEEIVGQSTDVDGNATNITQKPVMMGGGDATFSFETMSLTRLNVAFVFDDGTIEFHPIGSIIQENNANHVGDEDYTELNPDTDYLTEYSVGILSEKNINYISITSDEVNVWNSCHWIDLGNGTGEYDIPQHIVDNPQESDFNMAPVAGDNIVQLGYRYTNIENPTQEDKSRASAIIIAAYKTPDPDVRPPSYAQYQNINDFSLITHRGTYMDATGAHIVGILEGGTTIGEGVTIPVEVEQYKLIGNTAIYKDTNNNFSPTSITFSILHSTSQSTQILNTLPTGFTLEVNSVAQNSLVVNSAQTLSIRLKEGNKIWDGIEIEATSIDALNGQNGEWTEYIYRAYTESTPSLPTNGIAWDNMTTTQKSNWVKSQPTLSGNNTYVWQSWRRVTYDSSNNAVYTDNWKSPTRLTGINGEPGRDGNGEENIFKHYKEELTAPQLNQAEHNPYKWGGNLSEADVTSFLTTYNWNQSPQGIDTSYMYEYVSTRRKYLDTDSSSNTYNQMIWSYFSEPVIWSKWGENGQDGDGVKYIFRKYKVIAVGDNYTPTFRGNGYPNTSTSYPDTNNNVWYDNSMEPDATGDVYCSQSTNYQVVEVNGTKQIFWTDFQEPKRWLTYVKDGETGSQGPTGPQGENGESYQLLKLSEVFEVTIDKSNTNKSGSLDNVTGAVNTHFRYMIDKVDGDTHHIMTTSELNTEHIQMKLEWDNSVKVNNTETNSLTYIDLVPQTESGTGYGYFDFSRANLLNSQFTNSYTDYYYLHKNNYTNYMPTKTDIYIVDSGVKYEMENVPLIFKPDHYFKFGDYAFNSLYQGLSGNQDGEFTTTGWSLIHQDWANVSLGVYNINNVMNGGGYPTSSTTEHYIYKTQSTKPSKPSGTSNTGTWSAPSGWSKTPTTPDGSYTYCWISNSVRQRTTSGYSSTWSAWSDPQIISSYTNGGVVFTSSVNSAQLDITANQIKSEVAATYVTDSELSTARSEILQQANVIAAGVYNTNANGYQTASEVQITANNIALGVYSDIDGKLRNTGINIQDNTISLDSANTTIGGEVYIHEGEMLSDGINKETQIMIGSTSNTTYTGGSVTTTPQVVRTFISGETLKITDLSCGYYNSYTGVWAERISGATFYLKKGTTYQQITTSTSITFTSSTAGEYSFYCTYNNTPANCKLYGWLVGTSSLANVTEICSEGINIANNNNFLQFNTSDKKFEVQTNITGSGSINSSGFGMKVDNGIPKMMYSRQSPGTPISGGSFPNDLNDPTFYPTEAFDSWGTIGTQISIVNCDSTLSYYTIHRDIDMYLFTAPTSNQTFDISGTVNNTTRGLYNGRIIYIKGHPKLTISNGSNQIVLKNQYWNNSGGTSFTMNSSTGYSMIFVLYSGTWIQL